MHLRLHQLFGLREELRLNRLSSYPSLRRDRTQALIDEGNQISRMTYNLMRKLSPENDPR